MAGVNWESLSPCKPIIRSWRKSTPESAVIHVVVELGEMKYSAKFGNVGSFETTGGFLELECRAIRNSSMEASHWDKQTRESNRGDIVKVTACYKLKAWLHPLLSSLLPIWVNGEAWNVSILDPSQGFLMTCLLFPTSTEAPVEPGENGHQGQFSKGKWVQLPLRLRKVRAMRWGFLLLSLQMTTGTLVPSDEAAFSSRVTA